jgi:ATP adenylyltransferase
VDSKTADCVFCAMADEKIVAQNPFAYAVRDIAPVTPLHTLILPRRHVASFFDLDAREKQAIDELLDSRQQAILADDPAVAGFNVGINVGAAAGQTIFHCHIHLIPRRVGDVADPAGGVYSALRRVLGAPG